MTVDRGERFAVHRSRQQVRRRKIDFRFYLITDRRQLARESLLIAAVRRAFQGGVRAVQLREKDLGTRELLKIALNMKMVTTRYRGRLFINDRADIALAVGADGVHLTGRSIPVEAVRKSAGKRLLIGVSTHAVAEAREAQRAGADFVTFGPVYRTPSKLKYGRPVGIEKLRRVCRDTDIPVFALGGVKERNVNEVMKAGAYGVSMISEVLGASDIKKKSKALMMSLGEQKNER